MKKKWILLFAAAILFTFLSPVNLQTPKVYATAEEQTSYDYKKYPTEESYEAALQREMARVYNTLKGHIQTENLCPIPGIISTTYTDADAFKTSAYYIPQGLCKTDDYILMTAYHNGKVGKEVLEKNKGWHAVLYVIDAHSHAFITSLGLPQSYHNGGIAFDGKNVWFCGNTSPKYLRKNDPFVQSMKYEKLKEIIDNSGKYGEIPADAVSDKLYIDNVPSFLECDNNVLWVGSYINNDPEKNEGYIIGYPIQNIDETSPTLNKLNVARINGIPSSSQGMDIYDGSLYVSSSGKGNANWIQSSFISRFDLSALSEGSRFLDLNGTYASRIEVPKMNEEIIVDDATIYLVFESCSETFLKGMPQGMKTDRILPIDRSLWE